MSFSTPGPDSSIVSLSSRTGRESTGGMGAAADVIKGSCSPALRKKFWDSCRLRQAPQGVSAKFFFSMQEAPVRRVEQLRQKPSVSSASSSSSPRSAPSPSSGSSGLRGGGRESKRASTEESTVEVELDLTELPSIQYHAADTMYCLHKNGDEEVCSRYSMREEGRKWFYSPQALPPDTLRRGSLFGSAYRRCDLHIQTVLSKLSFPASCLSTHVSCHSVAVSSRECVSLPCLWEGPYCSLAPTEDINMPRHGGQDSLPPVVLREFFWSL